MRNLSETESRPVSGATGGGPGVGTPVFSPDGQWLAYIEIPSGAVSILKRVPVSGGTPVTVFEGGFPVSMSWPTPDTIVFAHERGILRVPANGGAVEVLAARADGEVLGSPKILPGGDAVLFTRATGNFGGAAFTDDTHAALGDLGYEGEADRLTVPIKPVPGGGRTVNQRTVNSLHSAVRALAERGNALLKSTFAALRRVTLCPWRVGAITAAALVLLHVEHNRTT